MKKVTPIAVATLALILQTGMVAAQDGNRERAERPAQARTDGERGPRLMMPLMRALDANGDGVIDAEEIANASAALLTLDKNGDGQLTREEFRGGPPEGREPRAEGRGERTERSRGDRERTQEERARGEGAPERRWAPPLLAALDANGDGTIDAAEIANASKALLKLDANKDGKLTAEELRPQRPAGAPERQRPEQSQRPAQAGDDQRPERTQQRDRPNRP